MTKKKISELRNKIDSLDQKIVRLLNQRAGLAMTIGKVKSHSRTEPYVPSREKIIMNNITKTSRGPLPSSALFSIYREIMSASLALEKNVKVAYLGPPATFSHQAAIRRFGGSIGYLPCETIDDVFDRVQRKDADYGVVPVENSIEGAVVNTLDRFVDTPLKICAEIYLPIRHYLLAAGPRNGVRRIMSNPNVFGQCRKFLRSEMPQAELIPAASTARAAEMAAANKQTAAIAGRLAAEVYRLKILNADIQDVSGNMTRFLVVGKSPAEKTGDDKTSLVFSVKHCAGALHRALGSFRKYNLNMTKIESRPSRLKAWEYLFFVDIEGHLANINVRKALHDLEKHCLLLTILGSYPKAIEFIE
ncbi:MAG: prephenate dehydratase [Kiritimatiellia bacterium]|nr:prephenate dehydratase [Kiritimatiellia bacterium]